MSDSWRSAVADAGGGGGAVRALLELRPSPPSRPRYARTVTSALVVAFKNAIEGLRTRVNTLMKMSGVMRLGAALVLSACGSLEEATAPVEQGLPAALRRVPFL